MSEAEDKKKTTEFKPPIKREGHFEPDPDNPNNRRVWVPDWKGIRVYGTDDRLTVCQILLKNGYAVRLGKERSSGTKNVNYLVQYRDDPEAVPVSRSQK